MEYIHNYHKDINYISVNRCQDHNFFIPKREDDEKSVYKGGSRFISLNGEFDFHYYKSGSVYKEEDKFEKIKVPSSFQSFGYGKVCYINDQYLIKYNPPIVEDSDFGVYKKTFNLNKKENRKYYINFEGKDSCLYLYVNGKFVGFDSVSHANSEFDVTDYLVKGKNEILVFVYVSCVGTYLECQDKFRLSGLFRDVYILEREAEHINSYKISYEKDKYGVSVKIKFDSNNIEKKIKVTADNKVVYKNVTTEEEVSFIIENPHMWNAEDPFLYDVTIVANKEVIYDYIGIRFVEIKDNLFTFNDRNIKLLGVNHHDSSYETGYYLSLNDYKKDIDVIKAHNMNTIRTSHYPPAPELLFLCDEAGIYVIEEADVECHGAIYKSGKANLDDYDDITNREDFKDIIIDRQTRMIKRDINRPSVIIWSTGNEAGFGKSMIEAIKYVKKADSTRLVHYESTISKDKENNYQLDFISKMYPSIETMQETIANDPRSLFLCEYSHSMGNSCGDVYEYVNKMYSNDRFFGGCIWEYNDHTFKIASNMNRPGYGGDFDEPNHSGNFCVDGLVDYKRVPHSNMKEVKAAYAKLIITKDGDNYYLENRFDFTDARNVKVSITFNSSKYTKAFDINAREKTLVFTKTSGVSKLLFKVYYNNTLYGAYSFKEDNLVETDFSYMNGDTVFFDQKMLCNAKYNIIINKETGLIDMMMKGNTVIAHGSNIALNRAYIDNDVNDKVKWEKYGLNNYKVVATEKSFNNNELTVKVKIDNIATGTITYFLAGKIFRMKMEFDINKKIEYLPRFGLMLKLDKSYSRCVYEGYGPYESYVDKYHMDEYGKFVELGFKPVEYLKPQECNSHLINKLMVFNLTSGIRINGAHSFNFSPYSIEQLQTRKHNYELSKESANYLFLDYMMSGVGSNSCGPSLDSKYRLTLKHIDYKLEFELL